MGLTILCDMDGIVVNLHKKWYDTYNERYGDDLTQDKVVEWDTHKFAKHGTLVYEVLKEPGFFREVDPIPGALEALAKFKEVGHRVVLVTAATRYGATDKLLWLEKYAPWFDQKQVLIGYPKELVKGDVLIDDGPHNLLGNAKAWPDTKRISIAYPYNRHVAGLCSLYAEDFHKPEKCWRAISEYILKAGIYW